MCIRDSVALDVAVLDVAVREGYGGVAALVVNGEPAVVGRHHGHRDAVDHRGASATHSHLGCRARACEGHAATDFASSASMAVMRRCSSSGTPILAMIAEEKPRTTCPRATIQVIPRLWR